MITPAAISAWEEPFRPRWPLTMYALAASRHMHQFGTICEQLAAVAVAAREWAQLNPVAFERGPLSVAEVLAARPVCDPLGVRDCCLVTDGGGALVLTSVEWAREAPKPAAHLLGCGVAAWHRDISQIPDLTVTAATESGARAFAMAGLTPADVDVVELYDAFMINPILFLEDLGFCAKGEGELPVNTNGGGLSYCHPGMSGSSP